MRSSVSPLKHLRFSPLETLPTDHTTTAFRDSFFKPQRPVVFPRRLFRDLPAIARWFLNDRDNSTLAAGASLNYDYLGNYGDCHVPLELTQRSAAATRASASEAEKKPESAGDYSFNRSYAPLSLFLGWTRAAQQKQQKPDSITPSRETADHTRLYLAQCQLLDLHADLRADLPTPSIVSTAGKGDVYDTNVWMGLAPTYTPLHRDPNPNLFVQLAGTKRVRLLAPEIGRGVFARAREELEKSGGNAHAAFRGEEMMQGPEREALDREVWGDRGGSMSEEETQFNGYESRLEAGDGVFIPLGWWHSIKGEGVGITASYGVILAAFLTHPADVDCASQTFYGAVDEACFHTQRISLPKVFTHLLLPTNLWDIDRKIASRR